MEEKKKPDTWSREKVVAVVILFSFGFLWGFLDPVLGI